MDPPIGQERRAPVTPTSSSRYNRRRSSGSRDERYRSGKRKLFKIKQNQFHVIRLQLLQDNLFHSDSAKTRSMNSIHILTSEKQYQYLLRVGLLGGNLVWIECVLMFWTGTVCSQIWYKAINLKRAPKPLKVLQISLMSAANQTKMSKQKPQSDLMKMNQAEIVCPSSRSENIFMLPGLLLVSSEIQLSHIQFLWENYYFY